MSYTPLRGGVASPLVTTTPTRNSYKRTGGTKRAVGTQPAWYYYTVGTPEGVLLEHPTTFIWHNSGIKYSEKIQESKNTA